MSNAFGFQLVVLSWFGLIFGQFWVNRRFLLAFITGLLAVAVNVLAEVVVADASPDLWSEVYWHGLIVTLAGLGNIGLFFCCRFMGLMNYDPNYRLLGGKRRDHATGAELEENKDKKE